MFTRLSSRSSIAVSCRNLALAATKKVVRSNALPSVAVMVGFRPMASAPALSVKNPDMFCRQCEQTQVSFTVG